MRGQPILSLAVPAPVAAAEHPVNYVLLMSRGLAGAYSELHLRPAAAASRGDRDLTPVIKPWLIRQMTSTPAILAHRAVA